MAASYSDTTSARAYNDDNQRLVSVDEDMNFPARVSARQAARLKDPTTPEGVAVKSVVDEALEDYAPGGGGGGSAVPVLVPDAEHPGLYLMTEAGPLIADPEHAGLFIIGE